MNKAIKLLSCSKNEKFYKTTTGKIYSKRKLISLIKNNKAVVTTSSGTEVSIFERHGKEFLRTNHNGKLSDNLSQILLPLDIKFRIWQVVGIFSSALIISNAIWLGFFMTKPGSNGPLETGVQLQVYNTKVDIGSEDAIWCSVKLWNFDADPTTFTWNHEDIFTFVYDDSGTYTDAYYFEIFLKDTVTTASTVTLSCNVDELESNPFSIDVMNVVDPVLVLEINATNLSTYFHGSVDSLGTAKPSLGAYLSSREGSFVEEIDFVGIKAIEYTRIFTNADYINTESGQIKTLDFTRSSVSSFQENFRETKSLEIFRVGNIYVRDYTFYNSSLEQIISSGEFGPPVGISGFEDCFYLRLIQARTFYIPSTAGQPPFGPNCFTNAGINTSPNQVRSTYGGISNAFAFVNRAHDESNMIYSRWNAIS